MSSMSYQHHIQKTLHVLAAISVRVLKAFAYTYMIIITKMSNLYWIKIGLQDC